MDVLENMKAISPNDLKEFKLLDQKIRNCKNKLKKLK
jgi:hypothetical protein